MNILFAINVPYPFGMAGSMRIRLFAEYLSNQKSKTKVLITNQDNGINDIKGVHNGVFYSSLLDRKLPYYIFLFLYPFLVFKKLRSERNIEGNNFLVIYGDTDIYTLPFIISAKILGYKIILDIVEDRLLTQEKLSILARVNLFVGEIIFPLAVRLVDGIVVISKYLEKKYKSVTKLPVILITVSAANLNTKRISKGKKKEFIEIAYSGSFGRKDGVEYLIEAFNQIQYKYDNVRLILIGTPKKGFTNKKISKDIEITGYLNDDDYQAKLSNADILCMTRIDSKFAQAGFPFKLGEYLATAQPVVATDVSDVSLYLDHLQDIILAKPSDTKSLVDSIELLIKSPEKRKVIGENGRKKCEKYFNPEINSKMLFDFMKTINS